MRIKTLIVAVLFAIPMWGAILTVVCACAEQQVPAVAGDASQAIGTARENLDEVAAFLEQAQRDLDALPALNDSIVAFRAAYDAEEYSAAVEHLRDAVATVQAAGHDVPAAIPERLAQARLLLSLAGQ